MKKVDYKAVDVEVMLSDNSSKHLSSFWREKPLALIFPRFFGCPFGRRQILQLCHEQNALIDAGIDVVLVSSGTSAQAETFRHDYKVPFTIVCDPDCTLFKKYGLREMSLRGYLSPRMHAKTIHVLAQGYGHKFGEGSEAQLGGVFIIDTSGKVRFDHIATDPADHPSPQDIIQAAATIHAAPILTDQSKKVSITGNAQISERRIPVSATAGEVSIPPEEIKAGKWMAFAAYLFFPIPLLAGTCRRNAFVFYHTREAIPMTLINVTGLILAAVGHFSSSEGLVLTIVGSVLHYSMFVLLFIGVFNALKGRVKPLPLLGRLTSTFPLLK